MNKLLKDFNDWRMRRYLERIDRMRSADLFNYVWAASNRMALEKSMTIWEADSITVGALLDWLVKRDD